MNIIEIDVKKEDIHRMDKLATYLITVDVLNAYEYTLDGHFKLWYDISSNEGEIIL